MFNFNDENEFVVLPYFCIYPSHDMAILIIIFNYFSLMTFMDQLWLHIVKEVWARNVKQGDLIGNKSNTFPVLCILN